MARHVPALQVRRAVHLALRPRHRGDHLAAVGPPRRGRGLRAGGDPASIAAARPRGVRALSRGGAAVRRRRVGLPAAARVGGARVRGRRDHRQARPRPLPCAGRVDAAAHGLPGHGCRVARRRLHRDVRRAGGAIRRRHVGEAYGRESLGTPDGGGCSSATRCSSRSGRPGSGDCCCGSGSCGSWREWTSAWWRPTPTGWAACASF